MGTIAKRGNSYTCQIRRKGHKSLSRTFPRKSLAVEWMRKIEAAMDAGEYSDLKKQSDYRLSDIIALYTDDIGSMKQFGRNKTQVLRSLNLSLGKHTVSDLTEDLLIGYVKQRMKTGAGGVTVSIDLSYLSTLLRYARTRLKIPCSLDLIQSVRDNLKYMGVNMRSNARERRPTKDELAKLYGYWDNNRLLKTPMSDIVKFAIETAMRDSEIMRITWNDLDVERKVILIRDRKHPQEKLGNHQKIPLLGEAFDIVMRQPKVSDRIFPYSPHSVSTYFTRSCKMLGIKDLRLHDMRHEGISRLFEQGYTIEQVRLVSGHTGPNMLFRYVNLRAEDLHDHPSQKKPAKP